MLAHDSNQVRLVRRHRRIKIIKLRPKRDSWRALGHHLHLIAVDERFCLRGEPIHVSEGIRRSHGRQRPRVERCPGRLHELRVLRDPNGAMCPRALPLSSAR